MSKKIWIVLLMIILITFAFIILIEKNIQNNTRDTSGMIYNKNENIRNNNLTENETKQIVSRLKSLGYLN